MGKSIYIKGVLIAILAGSIYYLIKNFPDQSILIIGIAAIIIIGIWLKQMEEESN